MSVYPNSYDPAIRLKERTVASKVYILTSRTFVSLENHLLYRPVKVLVPLRMHEWKKLSFTVIIPADRFRLGA